MESYSSYPIEQINYAKVTLKLNTKYPSTQHSSSIPLHNRILSIMTSSKINLPDDVLFSRLLRLVHEYQDQTIVDDHSHGTQFGYRHVLDGTSKLLQKLQDLHGYTPEHSGDFFIAVLAPNGYEFIIAVLAVLAFGGVVVPMRELDTAAMRP